MAGTGGAVEFLGWQPDDVIREHYRRCRALLFPGDEDFGIVPIEALACGMPVIALGAAAWRRPWINESGSPTPEPTSAGLLAAMDDWEAGGCAFDPAEARRRAEALSLDVFRDRILGLIAEVTARHRAPRPAGAAFQFASRRKSVSTLTHRGEHLTDELS